MTPVEREYALALLHESRNRYLTLISRLSDSQLRQKPSTGWSPAEITEHLYLVEEARLTSFRNILSRPPNPDGHSDMEGKDQELIHFVSSRHSSVQAPERFHPKGLEAPAVYLENYKSGRERNIVFLTETSADLRRYFQKHLVFGQLDLYQWMLLLAAHNDRHTAQVIQATI